MEVKVLQENTIDQSALKRTMDQLKEKEAKLIESAKKFESFFVGFIFNEINKSIPKEGMLNSSGEEMYQGLFIQELAKSGENGPGGGLGLADQLIREFRSRQRSALAYQEHLEKMATEQVKESSEIDKNEEVTGLESAKNLNEKDKLN